MYIGNSASLSLNEEPVSKLTAVSVQPESRNTTDSTLMLLLVSYVGSLLLFIFPSLSPLSFSLHHHFFLLQSQSMLWITLLLLSANTVIFPPVSPVRLLSILSVTYTTRTIHSAWLTVFYFSLIAMLDPDYESNMCRYVTICFICFFSLVFVFTFEGS